MNAPLLEVTHLKTWFPIRRGVWARTVGYVRAVDGVSLVVGKGETLALVGESGCGKTTVARTILRLEPAGSGEVRFEGHDLLRLQGRVLRETRRRMQIVFQDPFASLNPRLPVIDIVTEGLSICCRLRRHEREAAAERMLAEVGLGGDALYRYPHEFSGGQRQRIAIARALAVQPSLVICDEAVSSLDVSVQAQVLNLLMDLRQGRGLSYLFITHDLGVVRQIADRVAVMYLGRIVEEGMADEVLNAAAHPYTRALLSAVPRVGERRQSVAILEGEVPSAASPPPGCRFHPRCPYAVEECRRMIPELQPVRRGDSHRVACGRVGSI